MFKEKEKYNTSKLIRLKNYNYSENGYYFVTVCAKNNLGWFGNIENGKTELNEFGKIAKNLWLEIPRHFENVNLDEFVIMPNHIHGIVIIVGCRHAQSVVGNRHAYSLRMGRQYQTIPVIIGSYKSAVSREIHRMENGINFRWQKSFYEHIIRNENDLNRIREYIFNNPIKQQLLSS